MNKQTYRDWLRHILIVLLLISAFFLLRHTGYYAGIKGLLSGTAERSESAGTPDREPLGASVAVRPVAVTVCGPEGGAVSVQVCSSPKKNRFSLPSGITWIGLI